MSLVEVDDVGLQPRQRAVHGLHHVATRQSLPFRHRVAELGGDQHLLATAAALGDPVPQHGFGLAARMSWRPAGIDVGGVDQVEAMVDEGVQQLEAPRRVGGPAEHIAAERPRGDLKPRPAEFLGLHRSLRIAARRQLAPMPSDGQRLFRRPALRQARTPDDTGHLHPGRAGLAKGLAAGARRRAGRDHRA